MQCVRCGHINKASARFCGGCGAMLVVAAPPTAGQLTGRLVANTILSNRYLIVRKVGQGGMAAVYEGLDTRISGRTCAIKEMSDAQIADPLERKAAVDSFQAEASLLARLEHPHIPRVHDYFEAAGRHYLVMDYVNGLSLEKLLVQQNHPFTEAEVRVWIAQLCNALSYLHRQVPPIIFRDLKPDNIMVDQQQQIKLIDFGIARRFDATKRKDTTYFGTGGYAAPEQHGIAQTDGRTDIYALGVTLHRLLTGYDPSQHPRQLLPQPRTLNPAISDAMERLIMRSVEHDQAKRWQSVDEIMHHLGIPVNTSSQLPTSSSNGGNFPGVQVSSTSRPTTRLVNIMAKLTPRQLLTALSGSLLAIVVGILLLAPWVKTNAPFVWNNLPSFLIIGPAVYAALKRPGFAFGSHLPITLVGWSVLWLRTGHQWPNFANFLAGIVLSGFVFEVSFYLLTNHTQIARDPNLWRQEIAWYAATTLLAAIAFYGPWQGRALLLAPLILIGAALVGVAGWWIGDLSREGLKRRGYVGP